MTELQLPEDDEQAIQKLISLTQSSLLERGVNLSVALATLEHHLVRRFVKPKTVDRGDIVMSLGDAVIRRTNGPGGSEYRIEAAGEFRPGRYLSLNSAREAHSLSDEALRELAGEDGLGYSDLTDVRYKAASLRGAAGASK